MVITASSVYNLRSKRGLPLTNQVLGWVALGKALSLAPSPLLTIDCIAHPPCLEPFLSIVSASLFPFVCSVKHQTPHSKILSYFLAFSACFVILSISVEGLFFVSYSALLVVWVEVEVAIQPSPSLQNKPTGNPTDGGASGAAAMVAGYRPRADDLRIALFFLFFVQAAFFGTGNVASIS